MEIRPGIEFVICTYNRSVYLKQCVTGLLPQMVPGKTALTVVDNHSTDETKEWVMELSKAHPALRYLYEPEQGLSHARNKAWRESRMEWVFYIDDDCLPPEGFVDAALQLVAHYENFDAFGGPIVALYKETHSHWMPDGFGNFSMPFKEVTLMESGYARGPCLLIRKQVLERLSGFDTNLGVIGNSLRYGEEIELQMKMRKAGFRIGYAPSLQIGHFVRTEKTGVGWLLHTEYARRRDKMLFDPISFSLATIHLFRSILGRVIWTPVHLFQMVTVKSYPLQRALYDIFKPLAFSTGEWIGVVIYALRIKSQSNQK
jgi:GT2 family glycosyltransferase